MQLHVDLQRCRGHGQCVIAAPHVLRIGTRGQSTLINESLTDSFIDEARDAELLCPEEAISLTSDSDPAPLLPPPAVSLEN